MGAIATTTKAKQQQKQQQQQQTRQQDMKAINIFYIFIATQISIIIFKERRHCYNH